MQDFATHLLKFSWLLMNQKKGVISIDARFNPPYPRSTREEEKRKYFIILKRKRITLLHNLDRVKRIKRPNDARSHKV